jgi:tRNA G18 (ribose-2'-O)-methylase SpoU
MGNEMVGVSTEMVDVANRLIFLPLMGWNDSLNLGIATALLVQWFFHQAPVCISLLLS